MFQISPFDKRGRGVSKRQVRLGSDRRLHPLIGRDILRVLGSLVLGTGRACFARL